MSPDESKNPDAEESENRKKSSRLWTPYGDPLKDRQASREKTSNGPRKPGGREEAPEEMSEEELQRRIAEAMEKITVADVVLDMMVSLSSLAYQRMGIPHEVNEKYRDLEQAKLAIDCLDSLTKTLEDRVDKDSLDALKRTVDNLKMNFAKES